MNSKVKCDLCNVYVEVRPSDVVKKVRKVDFIEVTCTYLKCTACGNLCLKQIDTEDTLELCKQLISFKVSEMKKNASGKAMLPKQKAKALRLNKKLDNMRKQINSLYWDSIYQLEE